MLTIYWIGVGTGVMLGCALGGIVAVGTMLYLTRKSVDAPLLSWPEEA